MLDDSTCKHTRALVDDAAAEWQERGVHVEVVRRTNRAGYKAGALKDVRSVPDALSFVCLAWVLVASVSVFSHNAVASA